MRAGVSLASSVLALASLAFAQRPANTSICDYYAAALLDTSNVTTQEIVLTLVVNTAVIGNYTEPNVNISVPGILKPGKFNGQDVDLLPYFNGALSSSNPPGSKAPKGVPVNWLDGGGADPLMANQLGTEGSHQATLMMHLYTYFADLLGCSEFGASINKYTGDTSMYNVHKYMALSNAEVGYFISQVGLAAASFGVADADVKAITAALSGTFGYKCAPKTVVVPGSDAELQAICIADDCPLSKNATCDPYAMVLSPQYANGTTHNGSGMTNGTAMNTTTTGTGGNNATKPTTTMATASSKSSHAANSTGDAAELAGVNLVLAGVLGAVAVALF